MLKKLFLFLLLLMPWIQNAQSFTLTGMVSDSIGDERLIGANIIIEELETGKVLYAGVTDANGLFSISNIARGEYYLKFSYIGYKILKWYLKMDRDIEVGNIQLKPDPTLLDEAKVINIQDRVKQIGDTTQYNANSFKVNPDASAQDLLTKMPGIVVEDGKVQAQGEEVKKVLVDGKEFFSSDPTLALQALPADIIDQVQVFDDKSEQSKFTGFDDGEALKTLNIKTKPGKKNGTFGKAYLGYGTDERYSGGFSLNHFKNDQRISLLGNFNNINKQNFSTEDILGAIGTSSGRRGGFRGGGGTSVGDFLVGQQNGIVTTNALGLNYVDEWGKKFKVTGSYFFNETQNNSQSLLNRTYFSEDLASQTYSQNDSSESDNFSHRVNMRVEYTLNEQNSFIFTPSLRLQDYSSYSELFGATYMEDQVLNSTNSINSIYRAGYNFTGDLLWRHKFEKPKRTLSLNLRTGFDAQDGEEKNQSDNYFSENDSLWALDQRTNLNSSGNSYGVSARFTEPIGKKGMLMLDYSPKITYSNSDRSTSTLDSLNDYSLVEPTLSSVFNSSYQVQEGRVGYAVRSREKNFMLRLGYQNAILNVDQEYPTSYGASRTFNALLPMAMFRKKISDTSNIRVFYRSRSQAPTVSQLQDVIDNSNTLQLTSGNPNLDQEVRHFMVGHYALNTPKKGRTFFLFLSGEFRQDYIGNSTFTTSQDTSINGYLLSEGSQFTQPVNLDDYFNGRTVLTYGLPVQSIKSNLNFNLGGSYTNAPGLINDETNFTRTANLNGGVVLGSNISEKVDFTLNYKGNYNWVTNTLATTVDNNYFNHTASAKFNWLFGKGFVLNTDITQSYYAGLSEGIDQSFLLWNAYLGYKFLKGDAAELKISVFDILGQNTSISRTITETYLEDVQTNVLQRYAMLSFTYTLRSFKSTEPSADQKERMRMHELLGPPQGR